MKYLKLFENHTQYEQYITGETAVLPNVSHCIQEAEVHYNPITPPKPMNIITYTASAKLTETQSSYSSGLHTNAFSGANGQLIITDHTFENGVGTIEFDEDITSIGEYAFYNCSSLTSINIPDSITSICHDAFNTCLKLESINELKSATNIDYLAFYQCMALTNIVIGSNVTYIGYQTFQYCSSLTSITIKANTPPTLEHVNALSSTNDCQIYVPIGSVDTYKSASGWSSYASRIQAIPTT